MEKNEEKIVVTFNNEDEFIQGVMLEVLRSEFVDKLTTDIPSTMLLLPILGREFYEALAKYSRMQQVADVLRDSEDK